MPIINDSGNQTIFLGDTPVVEVRLGGQLLWPTEVVAPPKGGEDPIDIVEITLPNLNVKPIPNSTLPAFKKKDLDLLDEISTVGLSVGGLIDVALPALALPALPALSGIQIPCEGGTLPTRADIVNEFNKLAQMPSQLQVYIDSLPDIEEKLKAEKARLEAEARAKGEELESEIESAVQSEIAEIKEQIEGIIEQIEEVMDLISDILSPYWKKGQVRNWQKEADDAWNELIQEYHMFIPTKMLEMISKVIPIGFDVNIIGIQINVLKIFEEQEQTRIISQIEAEVDKFHAMIPAEYQQFKGEFGMKCDEWRARCTWQYVKTEIVKWCTNALFAAFDALIGKFKEIWDALGLPDLPVPLGFDVESFIKGLIDEAKQQALQYKEDLIAEGEKLVGEIDQIKQDIENAPEKIEQEIEDLKKDIEGKAEEIRKEIEEFDVGDAAFNILIDKLEGVQLFGMSLLDVIGGEIEETVKMAEKDIDNLIKAARDFSANWEKELLNVWIKKIKSFLDAIGLGKLLDLLTLTLCDVLPLIGIPTSFDVELPV